MIGTVSTGVSRWASQTIHRTLEGLADGSVTRCPHYPERPAEMHAMFLHYGRAACLECALTFLADLITLPARCDQCSRSGIDLYDNLAVEGGIQLKYSTCEDCAANEDKERAGS